MTTQDSHHVWTGHVAATPMVISSHIELWQVLQPALLSVPAVQYSTVQSSSQPCSPYLETVVLVSLPPVTITEAEEGSGMEQAYL